MAEILSELELITKVAGSLEEGALVSIIDFLNRNISREGGFVDRAGGSDIYYTYFGLSSLIALGSEVPGSVKEFVAGFDEGDSLDFVHLCCLARCRGIIGLCCDVTKRVLDNIEKYRSGDGGYSHSALNAKEGTVYAAFLASRAYGDCGADVPNIEEMISTVKKIDGSSAGTVTTVLAASMVLLGEDAAERIINRCGADGGFGASEEAPLSDLLSTAAALYALRSGMVSLSKIRSSCTEFVDLLWCDDGGFAGNVADLKSDVEYTYYGLLALGCLAED